MTITTAGTNAHCTVE